MLDMISEKVKQHRKKSSDKSTNPELIYTISSMIEEIDGEIPNILDVEQWVTTLPMLDTQTILAYAEKLNNFIGIDKDLEVVCDLCGLTYNTAFRINNEFFRPSLDI